MLGTPESRPATRVRMRVVYLGDDSRKHGDGAGKGDGEGEKPVKECHQGACAVGDWGSA